MTHTRFVWPQCEHACLVIDHCCVQIALPLLQIVLWCILSHCWQQGSEINEHEGGISGQSQNTADMYICYELLRKILLKALLRGCGHNHMQGKLKGHILYGNWRLC